ncbi:IS701 family transposase, partial [Herbaspirillum sp. HC18]
YPADVAMIFPIAGCGRPRKNHVPDVVSRPAQEMLEGAKWQTVSWCRGTTRKLSARFAAKRVRVADGPPQRIGHLGLQHLPGKEVWLVGGHRSTGERKYYLSNLPVDTPLKKLADAIKARWVREQA